MSGYVLLNLLMELSYEFNEFNNTGAYIYHRSFQLPKISFLARKRHFLAICYTTL